MIGMLILCRLLMGTQYVDYAHTFMRNDWDGLNYLPCLIGHHRRYIVRTRICGIRSNFFRVRAYGSTTAVGGYQ